MSDEFDDVVRSGPYVSSEKARAEMKRLAVQNGLSYVQNPGGGEFFGIVRCQITTFDDIADLQLLRKAIESKRQ